MTESAELSAEQLKHIIEAALLAAGEPLNMAQLGALFSDDNPPANAEIGKALEALESDCQDRGIELRKVASGYRLQVKQAYQDWISRLWTERPKRYTRAALETLALVAYRQPITRGEIEEVRGVSLSSNIIRTLQERDWIRVVGHRDVPGKPALFGTTRTFLDYFNLESLDELPTLAEIKDMESLEPELDLEPSLSVMSDEEDEVPAAIEVGDGGSAIEEPGSEGDEPADEPVGADEPEADQFSDETEQDTPPG